MQRIKMVLGRIVTISIIGAILDVVLHALLAPTYKYDYPPSYFIQSGLFKPAAGLSLLLIFFLLSIVFIYIQNDLPGKKLLKGIRFGISFGVLWLIGVIGMTIFFNSPLLHEFLGGLCDCASIIICSFLLAYVAASDSPSIGNRSVERIIAVVVTIAVFFIVGQYLAFILMEGTPYFSLSGSATFIWTVILGLWASIVYVLLGQSVAKEKSLLKRSFLFGGFIIGIDWILFNLFVLLFVDLPFMDPVILSVLNILSIIIGVFVFEIVFQKINSK